MSDCIPCKVQKEITKKVSNVKSSLIRLFNGHIKMKMPDIPFEIQMEIINRLPVEPLIRFRSVSKPWKSFIDSSEFIKTYCSPHPHSFSILSYIQPNSCNVPMYICYDDNNLTLFKVVVVSPLLQQYRITEFVCACHGLLCLYGLYRDRDLMVVIWNPSIRKSFGIIAPFLGGGVISGSYFGFGVSSVTRDPTLVKLSYLVYGGMLSGVEVFTLSTGVWTEIPTSKWPRKSIKLNGSTNVVIADRFIYWAAFDDTNDNARNLMLVSFDLITKEFRVLDLLSSLTNELYGSSPMSMSVSISKLRESLVVYGCIMAEGVLSCGVWVMEHDSSFTKLFTIGAKVDKILGFKKSGEPIFEADNGDPTTTLVVYDPHSQQIKNLGIVGRKGSFFIGSYKESMLLLDQSDLQIYPYR